MTRMTLKELLAGKNPIMQEIRSGQTHNPAPFSMRSVLLLDSEICRKTLGYSVSDGAPEIQRGVDIPVCKIAGMLDPGNLTGEHIFEEGVTTFHDLLFDFLHGASLTEKCKDYFENESPKWKTDFPDDKELNNIASKLVARGFVDFSERNGWYFVSK